jgi:hypothetical protein
METIAGEAPSCPGGSASFTDKMARMGPLFSGRSGRGSRSKR